MIFGRAGGCKSARRPRKRRLFHVEQSVRIALEANCSTWNIHASSMFHVEHSGSHQVCTPVFHVDQLRAGGGANVPRGTAGRQNRAIVPRGTFTRRERKTTATWPFPVRFWIPYIYLMFHVEHSARGRAGQDVHRLFHVEHSPAGRQSEQLFHVEHSASGAVAIVPRGTFPLGKTSTDCSTWNIGSLIRARAIVPPRGTSPQQEGKASNCSTWNIRETRGSPPIVPVDSRHSSTWNISQNGAGRKAAIVPRGTSAWLAFSECPILKGRRYRC